MQLENIKYQLIKNLLLPEISHAKNTSTSIIRFDLEKNTGKNKIL